MLKQIAASFIGTALALVVVGGVGYATVTGYIDSKLVVLDRVETIVNEGKEKIDKIFAVVEKGVTGVDDAVTNTKIYERFFGDKEEENTN